MKNTIYNKIRCAVLTVAGAMALGSCTDFLTITPTDRTVLEDFWKTKDDVDQMVTGAYKQFMADAIIERFIIWGGLRSDELVKNSAYTSSNLDNILAVNLLPSNGYNSWSAFYQVINTCNLIMAHAPEVLEIDPAFAEGDYQTVKSQMLALRALCHFYLIRTFRDVPYVTKAYENTSDLEVGAQLPPSETLQMCIDDLLEAEKGCYKYGTFGYGDWRNVGLLSKDAVDAILADVYLWRASMTGSQSDYEQVVYYTQKVIDSHESYYQKYKNQYSSYVSSSNVDNPYRLYDGNVARYYIFEQGNSSESVLELQFDGSNSSNNQVRNYYYTASSSNLYPIVMGSRVTGSLNEVTDPTTDSKSTDGLYTTKNDYRLWENSYGANDAGGQQFSVRKFVNTSSQSVSIPETGIGQLSLSSMWYSNYNKNWILYRITDILLMQAEAKTQLGSLSESYQLVKAVNNRSIRLKILDTQRNAYDTLSVAGYTTQLDMEMLCLQERGRELLYEGKRWYDLVRHSYRHMTGVDATKTLYEIDPNGKNYPTLGGEGNSLTSLMAQKGGTSGVSILMKNEGYLYWPILQSEIERNKLLHQNPVFVETKSTNRN